MNVTVLGDGETVTGFRLAGISSAKEIDVKNAETEFKKAVEERDIIIITEKFASQLREEIEKLQKKSRPVIVEIPGKGGPVGDAKEKMNEMVKRVVGVEMAVEEGKE